MKPKIGGRAVARQWQRLERARKLLRIYEDDLTRTQHTRKDLVLAAYQRGAASFGAVIEAERATIATDQMISRLENDAHRSAIGLWIARGEVPYRAGDRP